MDQPTVLEIGEINDWSSIVVRLKAEGVSVIDIITIGRRPSRSATYHALGDGHHDTDQPTNTSNVESLIRLMVGRDLGAVPQEVAACGYEILRVEGIQRGLHCRH